jgi:single-strand DNA-binding protein
MNKYIAIGNLAKDVEIRYIQGGSAVANTAIAVNTKYKNKGGEQVEDVMFIDLAFFGRTAEIVNQYLKKGSKISILGRLKLDTWTTKDGSKRSKHSVVVEELQMLDGKPQSEETTPSA